MVGTRIVDYKIDMVLFVDYASGITVFRTHETLKSVLRI